MGKRRKLLGKLTIVIGSGTQRAAGMTCAAARRGIELRGVVVLASSTLRRRGNLTHKHFKLQKVQNGVESVVSSTRHNVRSGKMNMNVVISQLRRNNAKEEEG